jgi:hypothetical protein
MEEFLNSCATGSFFTGAHVYGISLVNSSFYNGLRMERENECTKDINEEIL